MSRNIILFLLLITIPAFSGTTIAEFTSFSGDPIYIDICEMEDLPYCEKIFIDAFSEAYKEFSAEFLGVSDKYQFLKDAFNHVFEDVEKGVQILAVAKCNGEIIGFSGFKRTEKQGQIYISQLAVDPAHWRSGIGRNLVFSSLLIFDDLESLVVIPRKINSIAIKFYETIQFKTSDYMHPGYNPARYTGFEWTKPCLISKS